MLDEEKGIILWKTVNFKKYLTDEERSTLCTKIHPDRFWKDSSFPKVEMDSVDSTESWKIKKPVKNIILSGFGTQSHCHSSMLRSEPIPYLLVSLRHFHPHIVIHYWFLDLNDLRLTSKWAISSLGACLTGMAEALGSNPIGGNILLQDLFLVSYDSVESTECISF